MCCCRPRQHHAPRLFARKDRVQATCILVEERADDVGEELLSASRGRQDHPEQQAQLQLPIERDPSSTAARRFSSAPAVRERHELREWHERKRIPNAYLAMSAITGGIILVSRPSVARRSVICASTTIQMCFRPSR